MGKFINPHSKIFEHESQSGGHMSKFAIAHAMKKKRNKMAEGGEVNENVKGVHNTSSVDQGMSSAGFDVAKAKRAGGLHPDYKSEKLEDAKGKHHKVLGELVSMKKPNLKGLAEGGEVESAEMGEESPMSKGDMYDDLVDRIMMHKSYSEGGMVANDVGDGEVADEKENQFDDLVLDDDMDFSYTGDNSGDEIGNEQEDEDRHDIVSRMMKSSRKKDRNPRPA